MMVVGNKNIISTVLKYTIILLVALIVGLNATLLHEDIYSYANGEKGIMNNGAWGINININASPYTDFARGSQIAYTGVGCTWFVASRVKQLTGKGSIIYGPTQWYYNIYSQYGFTRGKTPQAPAIVCYGNHVSILEKISGSTAIISEGGATWRDWSDAAHGYCTIRSMPMSQLTSNMNGGFLGFVYLGSAPKPNPPSAPTNVKISKTDLGIGDAVNASWSASSGAKSYNAVLECTTNSSYNQSKSVTGTSASFTVKNAGSYRVKVSAKNDAGSSSATTSSNTATVHKNCTVKYVDWDGIQIGKTQSVKYGGNATAPTTPTREGYTFTKWSSDGKNIKADTTITAQYKINTYSVSFIDYNGNVIGSIQKIDYGSAATPPSDVPTKEGYIFTGWSSEEYKEVKRNLNIKAVYVWENINLPIITKIISATRNAEATGYDITVKLSNFPNDFTKGKLVAALKTKDGKMVASETKSISMPSTGETTETMTILYSGLASKVEVSMVGVIDDETTGTPKAKSVIADVDLGNEWSDWSTTVPEGDNIIKESRTEYRYKDRKVIKSATTPTTPSGYTLTNTANTGTYTEWTPWSSYGTAAISKTTLRDVQTTTGYRYHAFQCSYCGTRDPYSGTCSHCGKSMPSTTWKQDWGTQRGQDYSNGYTKIDNNKGRIYWKNVYWYFEFPGKSNGEGGTGQPTCTMYRSRTRQEYKNYTYWSTNWSTWSPTVATASADKQVETRTTYRFKNNGTDVPCYNYKRYRFENLNTNKTVYTYTSAYADSMDFPGQWEYNVTYSQLSKVSGDTGDDIDVYGGLGDQSWYKADVNTEGEITVFETVKSLEDSLGTKRVQEGTIDNAAGKVATLMIYKGNNDDPTASQIEYIGQTVLDEDGSYRFEYTTKEEPSTKTGDFIIALGVEGSTNYMVLGKIDAPKPICYVNFVDEEGNAIGEQKTVVSGGTVEAPEPPEKDGYEFICWDTALKNITENIVITAQYRKKTYVVVFVDWDGHELEIKEFEHGDVLTSESVPEREGKIFKKWIDDNDEQVVTVTQNMIVTADYTDAYYTIQFTDWDGNIISETQVPYGESVDAPNDLPAKNDKEVFSRWSDPVALTFVKENTVVTPVSKYISTAEEPEFTVKSGRYDSEQRVVLYSPSGDSVYYNIFDEDAVYSDDFNNNIDDYNKYSGPLTISSNSVVYAYSKGADKNDSEIVYEKIRIGDDTTLDSTTQSVVDKILLIPDRTEDISLERDKVLIRTTKTAYDNLTDDQKETITDYDKKKLQRSVETIDALEASSGIDVSDEDQAAADAVTLLINKIPNANNITLEDENKIVLAREAYDTLTEVQLTLISVENKEKLVNAESIIVRLKNAQEESIRAIQNVISKIEALPSIDALTLNEKAAVQAAQQAYENLKDSEKEQISSALINKLNGAIYRIQFLEQYDDEEINKAEADQRAADEVKELIRNLPDVENVNWENDHAQIENAKKQFDKLLPEQQDLIPYSLYSKLEAVYEELQRQDPRAEEERQRAERQNTVNTVIALIESIPDSGNLKLSDKSLVAYARERFDALTDEELELITLAQYRSCENRLSNAETTIRELEEAAEQTTVYLTGITATKTKREFSIGEKITTDDISVKASYSNGSSKNVSNFDTNVIDIDMSSSGQKTLVVSYKENGITMTASIAITVKDVAIMPIVLEIEGNTIYYVGQHIDLDEFTVKAHYSDGSSKKISNSPYQQNHYTTNINDIDMSISGSKDLVFTYTENGKTITKAVAITIKKKINIKNATIKGVHNVVYNKNTGAMERNYIDDIEVWYNGERLIKEDDVDFDDDYDYGTFCYCEDVGKGEITIYGEGIYTGTVTKYFKVLPRGTSLSKLSKRRKSMKVTWKKQAMKMSYSRITGYQIRYSTSSKMKKARTTSIKGYKKTSKVIKNLKSGKKYYVQIRTYKKVNGKNYYSKWSSKMSVKVK